MRNTRSQHGIPMSHFKKYYLESPNRAFRATGPKIGTLGTLGGLVPCGLC